MKFTRQIDASAQYVIVESIFFNADVVGVLEGKYILGAVSLKTLTAVRHERRLSFKHPVIGAILAALLFADVIPPLAWLIDIHIPAALPVLPFRASFFLLLGAIYLTWCVIRCREIPWIVFVNTTGERAFPLRKELSPEALATLNSLIGGRGK